MKKSSILASCIFTLSLFLYAPQAHALTINLGNLGDIFQTATPITPTPTPTPQMIKINPNLIKDIKIIGTITPTTGESSPTVTITPTGEAMSPTTTPASDAATPIVEKEATDTGIAQDESASDTANTQAKTGIETKDLITYGLLGAIVIVLVIQAFTQNKNKKPEEKKEE